MKLKVVYISHILLIIGLFILVLGLIFTYLYLTRPIFRPRANLFLLQTKKVEIEKELFNEIIFDLQARPSNAQKALEKWHPDPFKP